MVDVSGSIHFDDLKSTKKMLQKVTAGFILSSSGTLCSHDESMRVKKAETFRQWRLLRTK